jgi:uncharacterized membrane protein YoaK (UPF0700 family)
MRKLFLVIALFLAIQTVTVNQVKSENVQIELISDSLKQVLVSEATELLKDSAFRAELTEDLKQEYQEKPTEDSSLIEWIYYIVGIIMLIVGAFVSNMPTTKSYWWLQPLQAIIRFVFHQILAPKNKAKDGETHNI